MENKGFFSVLDSIYNFPSFLLSMEVILKNIGLLCGDYVLLQKTAVLLVLPHMFKIKLEDFCHFIGFPR